MSDCKAVVFCLMRLNSEKTFPIFSERQMLSLDWVGLSVVGRGAAHELGVGSDGKGAGETRTVEEGKGSEGARTVGTVAVGVEAGES